MSTVAPALPRDYMLLERTVLEGRFLVHAAQSYVLDKSNKKSSGPHFVCWWYSKDTFHHRCSDSKFKLKKEVRR